MNATTLYKFIKDGGIVAVLCIGLYTQNMRLLRVENALFDCMNDREIHGNNCPINTNTLAAIKPKSVKIKLS